MILTNAPGASNSETWAQASRAIRCTSTRLFDALRCGITLFDEAGRGPYMCVVLQGSQRADWVYAVLRGFVPFSRPPTAKLDCLWTRPASRLLYWLKRRQRQLEAHGVDKYYVYARREIVAFSETFGISKQKFRFIPYHHTLNQVDPTVRDDGYVFSGGSSGRDYSLLFTAVEGLPYRVEVACRSCKAMAGLPVPANVHIRSYSHEDYLEKMAGCRVNVVPLSGGQLRSFGQQTFLNSMALGKATVVTDPAGACDYIEHGGNGVLTPAGDVDALRAAIVKLMEDHDGRTAMELQARSVRDTHSTEAFFRNLIAMLDEDLGISDA